MIVADAIRDLIRGSLECGARLRHLKVNAFHADKYFPLKATCGVEP